MNNVADNRGAVFCVGIGTPVTCPQTAGARRFVSFCILRQFGDVRTGVARQVAVLTELGAISNVPLFPKPAGDFARRLPFDGQAARHDDLLPL